MTKTGYLLLPPRAFIIIIIMKFTFRHDVSILPLFSVSSPFVTMSGIGTLLAFTAEHRGVGAKWTHFLTAGSVYSGLNYNLQNNFSR